MIVAVVEDEAGVREAVSLALDDAGYTVTSYRDGLHAWESWNEALPDLVVLDITMPRMDGLELCRRLRAKSMDVPVIFLSSRDEEIDRVVGLELGADDCLCKPFSVRELVARVRALERRLRFSATAGPGEPVRNTIASGPLRLDLDAIRAYWHDELVSLTLTEFRLLETLVRNQGIVLTREQLLSAAYPDDVYVTERSIDSHIRRIRKKFEDTGFSLDSVSAVYGAGYRYQESGLRA
jgi:DNA-binding response OmpR family regulator